MDRFVAMIWDPVVQTRTHQAERWSERLRRASSRWRCVLERPGLRVLALAHRGPAPIAANIGAGGASARPEAAGVVIGPMFERGNEAGGRVRALSDAASAAILESGGDALVRRYWGNYVAIWSEPEGGRVAVVRDPCGAVPCFAAHAQGVELVFSHPDDVARLPGICWSIDWTYVQAFLLFNYFVTSATGLEGVTEVLPGERLTFERRGGAARAFVWNGAAIAAAPKRQSAAAASEEARALGETCFRAWGREYASIVASLSGGLDSSILINLMSRVSSARLTALHFVGAGYESYELKLARLAAERAGVEFIAVEQHPERDDVARVLKAPLLARPKAQSLAVLIDDLSVELAERVGADAFMIGHGGDNLFLQRGAALHTLSDYLRLEGLGSRVWQIAYESAVLKQQSVWGVLGDAAVGAWPTRRWAPYAMLERGDWAAHRPLTSEAAAALPQSYKLHPWFAEAARLPPGKGEHLSAIVALYNYHLHHGRGIERDVVYPFLSQPLVEFALKTPTYVLAHGGLDRAIERAAFGDLIPAEIVQRTGKGGADHYLLQVLEHHFGFFRELILDGELARQSWIARDKLEAMLQPGFAVQGAGALFIYLMAAAEAWLSTWRRGGVRVAA
ncbi:MAG TPA: asparagine synthase-related protein [Vitreimonas sp.]|uniref:asparagine synthase-related protein n=1 Tax=Vitreimonas sp. TaxID=3069702 RepID=UPI002D2F296B|nr:asparagine synthase-related protein [Vitreimonas sp.]HYD86052.1 asparagine synthase-related protein [Vitreimonas sp.]